MIGASIIEKIIYSFQRSTISRIIAGVSLGLVGILMILVLISFDAEDPSFLYATTAFKPYIFNIFGYIGSSCAGLLFLLFGVAAYLLVPATFFIAHLIVTDTMNEDFDRLVACVLGILCASGLCTYYGIVGSTQMLAGGKLGIQVLAFVTYLFDAPAAPLFLFICMAISMVLLMRLTWVIIGRYAIASVRFLHIAGVYVQPVLRACLRGMVHMVQATKKLWAFLRGKTVEEESIVTFEELVEESWQTEQEENDEFWAEFLGAESVQDASEAELQDEQYDASQEEPMMAPKPEPIKTEPPKKQYLLPNIEMFKIPDTAASQSAITKNCEALARVLEEKLERFGIKGSVTSIKVGPVITLFEYEPDIDSKISKIIALEDDLALALQAVSIRIIAPIPGRSVVGFEVSNKDRTDVMLSSIVHSKEFKQSKQHLPLILGHDVIGKPIIIDLTTTPHLLVAGSTGSGKSVALNAMLVSLLCKHSPEHLKIILIDPKRLEFASYADIAHLLFPIVTDPRKAAPVLRWVIQTMEKRYCIMEQVGVRNIFEYHEMCRDNPELEHMPFMVVMIDELSDLMMTTGKEIEDLIARITQMARAAGIHMIVATQRPSVDVITGLIKVNFPSRISFRVTSKVDSRTILDCIGADKLLGKGDMLYLDSSSRLIRAHGAYVSQREIDELVSHIKYQEDVEYVDLNELIVQDISIDEEEEQLYQEVVEFLKSVDEVSISLLQRKFRIGYNRSARIIELLEAQGLIMQEPGGKTRKVIH